MKETVILIVIGALGTVGNQRMSRDHLDYSIVKIDQTTEKSLGDMR